MLRTIPLAKPRKPDYGLKPTQLRRTQLGATAPLYSNTQSTPAGVALQSAIKTTITSIVRVGGTKYAAPSGLNDGIVGYQTCNAIAWLVREGYWASAAQFVDTSDGSFAAICNKESIDPNWTPVTKAPAKASSTTTTTTTTTTTPAGGTPTPAPTSSGGSGTVLAVLIGGGLGLGALALFAEHRKHNKRRRSKRRRR